jgi:hypothetical protein
MAGLENGFEPALAGEGSLGIRPFYTAVPRRLCDVLGVVVY